MELHWEKLHPSPLNKVIRSGGIDEGKLDELAASITEHGVLQPLTVWATPRGETPFEILLGERRWRATRSLGQDAPLLPCILKEGVEDETFRLILMGAENLQREDLSPIEEGRFYKLLLKGLTLKEVIRKLGKPRSRIVKLVALLELPPQVQAHLDKKRIPVAAAKHLKKLPADLQADVAEKMVGRTEGYIKKIVDRVLANQNGTANTAKVEAASSRPEAETVTRLVAILLGMIELNGDLLAHCADAISAFDADLAEEAFDAAAINSEIINKVKRRGAK